MADFFALWGEKEQALEWLENAANRGRICHRFLCEHDRFLAGLRGDPRFEQLMQRVKRECEEFEV